MSTEEDLRNIQREIQERYPVSVNAVNTAFFSFEDLLYRERFTTHKQARLCLIQRMNEDVSFIIEKKMAKAAYCIFHRIRYNIQLGERNNFHFSCLGNVEQVTNVHNTINRYYIQRIRANLIERQAEAQMEREMERVNAQLRQMPLEPLMHPVELQRQQNLQAINRDRETEMEIERRARWARSRNMEIERRARWARLRNIEDGVRLREIEEENNPPIENPPPISVDSGRLEATATVEEGRTIRHGDFLFLNGNGEVTNEVQDSESIGYALEDMNDGEVTFVVLRDSNGELQMSDFKYTGQTFAEEKKIPKRKIEL